MAKNENKAKKENNKRFFKDFKAEIKKVIWPTPKQLFNNTVAIISMVIIIGAIVFVLDLGFDAGNKYGLTQLQKSVQSSENVDTSESSDTESDNASTESIETDSVESTDSTTDESATSSTETEN